VSATVQAGPNAPRISQHRVGVVAVLSPRGGLDFEVAEELRELALGAHAPVVIDLGECVLIHPESIHRLAADQALHRPQMCLVCPRQSGRELLRLAAVDEHLAIFGTVEGALEELKRSKRWTPSHAADSAPMRAAR
jgi:anti-anti-sigma regulatory factor